MRPSSLSFSEFLTRDWGPAFPNMGIDQPLQIAFFSYRIESLVVRQKLDLSKNEAIIFLDLTLVGQVPSDVEVKVRMSFHDNPYPDLFRPIMVLLINSLTKLNSSKLDLLHGRSSSRSQSCGGHLNRVPNISTISLFRLDIMKSRRELA